MYPPDVLPQITQQPADQVNKDPGSTVKFTFIANTEFGTLAYKWQRDGPGLNCLPGVSGETTHTLKIDNVKKSHEGTYTCVVSNDFGPTTSKSARLTVRKVFFLISNSKFCN